MLHDDGGEHGFGVDPVGLSATLRCSECEGSVEVLRFAQELCAFLDRTVGRDPLSLRFPLAVRGAAHHARIQRPVRCPRCQGWDAHPTPFRQNEECVSNRRHFERLQEWFGVDLFAR